MNEKIKAYLEDKFGTPVKLISVKELGLNSKSTEGKEQDVKGFGYGKP